MKKEPHTRLSFLGRGEHTLHELLNHLLECSEEAKETLTDLRKACSLNNRNVNLDLTVVF